MSAKQDNLAPLQSRIGESMLGSKNLARLAYTAPDGTPRVTPVWFLWNGQEIVIGTEPDSFKVKSIRRNPKVAVTIDDNEVPYNGLQVRGAAKIQITEDLTPEFIDAAMRYLGEEEGRKYIAWAKEDYVPLAQITIRPEWASITGFEEFFNSIFSNHV